MNFLQIITAVIILYLCIYALINRICKCVEHCATARAYSEFRENDIRTKIDNLDVTVKKLNKERKDVKETIS